EVLANWDWVGPWWQRMMELEALWVMAWALAAVVVLGPFFIRRVPRVVIGLWLFAIGGTAFWFFMAPSPRFGWGPIYSVAAIPTALLLSQLSWLRVRRAAIPLTAAICLVPLMRERFVPETE